jgi:diaminopimelate decarboxylase
MKKLPEMGDLVCFVNTAGYLMHFYETHSHLLPLSTNLEMTVDSAGFPLFKVD